VTGPVHSYAFLNPECESCLLFCLLRNLTHLVVVDPCCAIVPDYHHFGKPVPVVPVGCCGHAVLDCLWLAGRGECSF
jgi:hypothetical protein